MVAKVISEIKSVSILDIFPETGPLQTFALLTLLLAFLEIIAINVSRWLQSYFYKFQILKVQQLTLLWTVTVSPYKYLLWIEW